ncbi:MAG: stage III sporulation protein AD [Firmicutes bacterium]|nr:stage III sporulation protein AD [Bacillota bacterium]
MESLQIVGFGVASALLAMTLRRDRPEMALVVSLAAGLCMLIAVMGRLGEVIAAMSSLAARAELPSAILPLLLRVIGVASLCELGTQLCRDAGEGGIAAKIELGGKLIVLVMAMPVAMELIELVLGILPS